MANKVSYAKLNLKVNNEVKTFKFKDQEIEVLQYLPIEDKYDLVMITLQKAEENGIYNELKLDMYFHLYLVYMYTNLSFTEKQKENESKLYDVLKSNGIIDNLLATIDEKEYNFLYDSINSIKKDTLKYTTTLASVINSLIQDLPANAEAAMQIVNSFDKSKFQDVINFAMAANGGRPIQGPSKNTTVTSPLPNEG